MVNEFRIRPQGRFCAASGSPQPPKAVEPKLFLLTGTVGLAVCHWCLRSRPVRRTTGPSSAVHPLPKTLATLRYISSR